MEMDTFPSWKVMEKSWNFVFEFVWEPCHAIIYLGGMFLFPRPLPFDFCYDLDIWV